MIIQTILKVKFIVLLLICSSVIYAELPTKQFMEEWHKSKSLKEKKIITTDFLRRDKSIKIPSSEEEIFLNFIITEYNKLPKYNKLKELKYQTLNIEQKNIYTIKASFLVILYPYKKNNNEVEKFFSSLKTSSNFMDQKLCEFTNIAYQKIYAKDVDSQNVSSVKEKIQEMPFQNFHKKLIRSIADQSESTKVRATIMLYARQNKIINEYKNAINVKYKDELLIKIEQALMNEKENVIKYPLVDIYVALALPKESEALLKRLLKEKQSNYSFKKTIEKRLRILEFKWQNF